MLKYKVTYARMGAYDTEEFSFELDKYQPCMAEAVRLLRERVTPGHVYMFSVWHMHDGEQDFCGSGYESVMLETE